MYESKRLILKHPVQSDWSAMYRNVWSHPETARYMLWDVTRSEEAAIARMERSIAFQKKHPAWFAYDKDSGQPIGFAGFCMLEQGIAEETGIALGPDYVGRGLGKELLNLLTEIARTEYHAAHFSAACRSENCASRGMILGCGFRFSHQEPRIDPRDGNNYILEFYQKDL